MSGTNYFGLGYFGEYFPAIGAGGPTNYPLTATSSAIALTGSSVILQFGRNLLATSSSLALAASNVGLSKGYSLSATSSAIVLSGSIATLTATAQPAGDIITGGGGHWHGRFKPRKEEEPEKPQLEIVKIGEGTPHEIVTGLVVPKIKTKVSRPAHLEALSRGQFNAEKLRSEQKRRLQLADDEWLMMN